MSDGEIMLTGSEYFPGLLWPLSINAKSAKGTDIGDNYIRDIDVGRICTRGVCTEGTCTKNTCIRNTCLRGASVGIVCVDSACASNTCARSTYVRNVFSAIGACIKGVGPEDICGSVHKPSKSSVKGSKLLVKSISKMPVSSCLRLQVILDSFL